MKRVPANKRDFSGLSSTSTIELSSDPINHVDGVSVPADMAAPNQAFATSGIHGPHGSHGDGGRTGGYEGVDFRRAGAYGTPLPMGAGGIAGVGGHGVKNGITADRI